MTADLVMALLFALAAGAAGAWGWFERAARLRAEDAASKAGVAQAAAEAEAERELGRGELEDLEDADFAAEVDAAADRLLSPDLSGLGRRAAQ